MKSKITGWLSSTIILLTSVLMSASPVLATISYTRSFVLNNTNIITYTGLPVQISTNNSLLIANSYLRSDGLDARVFLGTTSLPHMLADNSTYFVGDVPTGASQYYFKTNQSVLSSFQTIVGNSGFVTTTDNASLELGANFTNNITGYFNTGSTYVGTNIAYKSGAYRIYVYGTDVVRVSILNADNSENKTVDSPMSTGSHTLSITANVTHLTVSVIDSVNTLAVANITTSTAIGNPTQRKIFSAAGLTWVIYTNGTNHVYSSSYDSFTTATIIRAGSTPANMDCYWNGSYIDYAVLPDTGNTTTIYYRRGVPASNGVITWLAAEQLAVNQTAQNNPILTVDIYGIPWILHTTLTNGEALTASNSTNGIWTTRSGFPQTLRANGYTVTSLISLTNGAVVAWTYINSNVDTMFFPFINYAPLGETGYNVVGYGRIYGIGTTLYHLSNAGIMSYHLWTGEYSSSWTGTYSLGVTPYSFAFSNINDTLVVYYTTASNGTAIYTSNFTGGAWTTPQLIVSDILTSGTQWTLSQAGGLLAYQLGLSSPYSINYVTYTNTPIKSYLSIALNGTSVPNSSNNWTWMDAMPYTDSIILSVNGTQALKYAPNNIIAGTVLPDRSGAGNSGNITFGSFPLSAVSLSVLTQAPTNIDVTTATLNGALVDIDGLSSMSVYFEWGETTAYGHTTVPATMTAPGVFQANIVGLIYSNTYHVRAVATSGSVAIYGEDLAFATGGAAGASTVIKVQSSAHVFSHYIAAGDYLFVAEVQNTYNDGGNYTLYPSQNPKEYFTVQLIDTDNTTILAATPLQQWGDTPVGIYVNPTQAATLTYGAAYYIRLQANFAANISAQYQLVPTDWKGYDLTKLDDWAITIAKNMETFNHATYNSYTIVLTDGLTAITDLAGGYFTTGIANIAQVRPNLFTTSRQTPAFTVGTNNNTFDDPNAWTTAVGTGISTDVGFLATPFGMTGRDMLAAIIVFSMLGIVVTGTMSLGGFGALGLLLLTMPILWLGTWFRIIGVQWIMVLTIIFGLLAIRQFWIKTT